VKFSVVYAVYVVESVMITLTGYEVYTVMVAEYVAVVVSESMIVISLVETVTEVKVVGT
jgi:hypothetical protein